jgi:hypothetical protein
MKTGNLWPCDSHPQADKKQGLRSPWDSIPWRIKKRASARPDNWGICSKLFNAPGTDAQGDLKPLDILAKKQHLFIYKI